MEIGSEIISPRVESVTCKDDLCIGCREQEECEDIKKKIRNLLRRRIAGEFDHEKFLRLMDYQFGEKKEKTVIPWERLLGDKVDAVKDLIEMSDLKREKTINKLSEEWQEWFRETMIRLNYFGWFAPYVIDGKMEFKTVREPEFIDEE